MKLNQTYIVCITLICIEFIQTGCNNYLTRDIKTNISEEEATRSYEYSKELLTSLYTDLSEGFSFVDGIRIANATDNAEFTLKSANIQKFNVGSWNAFDNPDDVWNKYYKSIRKANLFLKWSDSINLDTYKLDPSTNSQEVYHDRVNKISRWRYEARFLRAFYYFQLIKRYGGIPLILKVFNLSDNFGQVKRNTLEECINFVVNECDSSAKHLPMEYDNVDRGRATKGAALALKSIVLLYAASDLFSNPSWTQGYEHPELISLTGDRRKKWKAAADAAYDVINLNIYTLSSDYSHLFGTNSFNDNEMIFVRRESSSNYLEKINYPIGFDLAEGGTIPSQNLVDAYEMKDGTQFDWDNPEEALSPYENRDPRLLKTVVTNNSLFKNRKVETWVGGLDGKPLPNATETGYYLRKYINENLDLLQNESSVHTWIFIRLAQIYLNYAEALNEYDPGNPNVSIYVNKVRNRAGMPNLPSGLSQDEMRRRIHHEDRIELAFEGHRFWNVRRWMTAMKYFTEPILGIQIEKGDNKFNYNVIKVENRVFEPKMYFYPIPQKDLNIDKKLIQNPLW